MMKRILTAIRKRFRKGLRTKEAVAISVVLHVLIVSAIASFLAGSFVVVRPDPSESLTLDLVTADEPVRAHDRLSGEQTPEQVGAQSESPDNGFKRNEANKQAILMASLGTLSDLRDSFRFVMQQASTDSAGLAPMQGTVPSTAFFGKGQDDGAGYGGRGLGVEFCSPVHGSY